MPDGKRNSLPPEGETEGVNCFFNDDDIQNSNGAAKRLPLSLNTRGYHNLNERLLKAMVANEIKKSLDGEDNKKLVAHHRPLLHSENEITESDMVVFGVVLNAKQYQNDEVSKAIEMLKRNGVSCVSFTIKDQPGSNGVKKDESTAISLEEKLNERVEQDENNLTQAECSDAAEKKVSSPTVSTTSDYTAPHDDDATEGTELVDFSCTSTTSPTSKTIENAEGPELELGEDSKLLEETELDNEPPSLSPSPPILFPQEPLVDNVEKSEDQEVIEAEEEKVSLAPKKVDAGSLRRKKRRKRMYPYVSRRKSKNKKRKLADPPPDIKQESFLDTIGLSPKESAPKPGESKTDAMTPTDSVDPYEFQESDSESQAIKSKTFVTPTNRSIRKVTIPVKASTTQQATKSSLISPPIGNVSTVKKKGAKGSPRKKLNFSNIRALSPDITQPGTLQNQRRKQNGKKNVEADFFDTVSPIKKSSCVQSISKDKNISNINTESENQETHTPSVASVSRIDIANDVKLVSPKNGQCDADIRANSTDAIIDSEVRTCDCDNTKKSEKEPASTAQVPSNVQTKVHKTEPSPESLESSEFLAPAPPNDSLQDSPDSMQLRRSSFYSSISRNVRTNLEKYLDGRPQDLKAPKRLKKVKNGFLLHHGDNFPDNPEAPYKLHLATQVLLKLNKRRVKFKPKEDKGKSLLSYLKLQPKRVTRVGKHSKSIAEETEPSSSAEPTSVFSGEWTVVRKYICNICGQVENAFWDMVMHKGEVHPGIVVTHVELIDNPPEGFRGPQIPRTSTTLPNPPPCSKCSIQFTSYDDLHRHIFECAGNARVLEEPVAPKVVPRKKKGKRKRGFKRRISSLPKKSINIATTSKTLVTTPVIKSGEITKRRYSEVFKCEFCTREFKTEGWLKNHVSLSHSLPISIPLEKLSLPSRASFSSSSRRITSQLLAKSSKQLCRET